MSNINNECFIWKRKTGGESQKTVESEEEEEIDISRLLTQATLDYCDLNTFGAKNT